MIGNIQEWGDNGSEKSKIFGSTLKSFQTIVFFISF
jgi:hypothetical protein